MEKTIRNSVGCKITGEFTEKEILWYLQNGWTIVEQGKQPSPPYSPEALWSGLRQAGSNAETRDEKAMPVSCANKEVAPPVKESKEVTLKWNKP